MNGARWLCIVTLESWASGLVREGRSPEDVMLHVIRVSFTCSLTLQHDVFETIGERKVSIFSSSIDTKTRTRELASASSTGTIRSLSKQGAVGRKRVGVQDAQPQSTYKQQHQA